MSLPPALKTTAEITWTVGATSYQYDVEAKVEEEGMLWTYTIERVGDTTPPLARWVLVLCEEVYDAIDQDSVNPDFSEFSAVDEDLVLWSGIIWEGFEGTSQSFSFRMKPGEGRSPVNNATAVAIGDKVDPKKVYYAWDAIMGPSCDPFSVNPVPLPPAVLMGAVAIGGIIGRRALRRKQA